MSEKSILVIEDDPMIAEVMNDIFTFMGYGSEWVTNGQDALELIEKKSFDLIIMDLELPKIPGSRLAEEIKKIRPDVRILFSTGYSEQEEHIDIDDPNCYGIIRKPFEIVDIKAAIEKALA